MTEQFKTCDRCGKACPVDVASCGTCGHAFRASFESPVQAEGLTKNRSKVALLNRRYNDGYIVARVTVGFGTGIKSIGSIMALLLILISVGYKDSLGDRIMYAGITLAVVIGATFFILGVLVSAQGQVLMASLDCAVNSSSILTDDQKAEIILFSKGEAGNVPGEVVASGPRGWTCKCGRFNANSGAECEACKRPPPVVSTV